MKKFLYVVLFLISNTLFSQQVVDLCLVKNSEFTYKVTSNVPNTIFYWELNGEHLFTQNPVIDWYNYPTGTYVLTVYGIANGCVSNTLKYQIIVEGCSSIYIPSSFTPNNDGINETWFPIGEGWETIEVNVFNRWGELIFYSNDIYGFWDGTYDGKLVENDVYVYQVIWKGIKNPLQVFYGKIVLIN